MGKKQFALLLLLLLTRQSTTGEVKNLLDEKEYKAVAAALSKLAAKGLLSVSRSKNKLYYSLSEAGRAEVERFKGSLCDKCLKLETVKELYR